MRGDRFHYTKDDRRAGHTRGLWSSSAVQAKESGRSGTRGEPTAGLASTADAVNRKADVAFGR